MQVFRISSLFLLLSFSLLFGQNAIFERSLSQGGGVRESGWTLTGTADGYLLAGTTTSCAGSACDNGMALFALDSVGTVKWHRKITSLSLDVLPLAITPAADGKILILTRFADDANFDYDAGLVMLNGDRSIAWINRYDYSTRDYLSDIQRVQGGYVVSGNSIIFKVDEAGTVLWSKSLVIGSGEEMALGSMWINPQGEIEVVGKYDDPTYIDAVTWYRIDPMNGNVLASSMYHAGPQAYLTTNGAIHVSGNDSLRYIISAGGQGAIILCIRADGTYQWAKKIPTFFYPKRIEVLEDGNLIIVGNIGSIATYSDAVILQLAPDGTVNWAQAYGGSQNESFHGLWIDRQCYLVAYGFARFNMIYSSYVVKTDMTGNSGGNYQPALTLSSAPVSFAAYSFSPAWVNAPLTLRSFANYLEHPILLDSLLCTQPYTATGCVSPVAVEPSESIQEAITLFPNPCSDELTIEFPQSFMGKSWVIWDGLGKKMMEGIAQQATALQVKDFPAGLYWIQLDNGLTRKFQVVH